MFDVLYPGQDHRAVRILIPLLALLLCGCPKLWGPCPGGVLNTFSLRDGEMTITDDSGSDVNWGDVENLNLEKCTEVQGSIFLQGEVRGLQKFSSVKNITGTIWFFDVRVDPPGLVEIFPALELLGGIDATEAHSRMEVFSGFRALKRAGALKLMALGTTRVEGFDVLEEAGDTTIRAAVAPTFNLLRTVGDMEIHGAATGLGTFGALQTAARINISGIGARAVLFPQLVSALEAEVTSCPALLELRAPALSSIRYLFVGSNFQLIDISLEGLREVSGSVTLGNSAVSTLAGFTRLRRVGGNLRITENRFLDQQEIDRFLAQLEVGGEIYVCSNGSEGVCP